MPLTSLGTNKIILYLLPSILKIESFSIKLSILVTTLLFNLKKTHKLSIPDKLVQGKIVRAIAKDSDRGSLLVALESNDVNAFTAKVGELTSAAILNHYKCDPGFMGDSSLIVGTAASALGHLAGGDYVAAQKAIAIGMTGKLNPQIRPIKQVQLMTAVIMSQRAISNS